LADIGDYQSIEQEPIYLAPLTLPTFDFISHAATAQSLVLLDELGSATDPEEGAALAVAICRSLPPDRMYSGHLYTFTLR